MIQFLIINGLLLRKGICDFDQFGFREEHFLFKFAETRKIRNELKQVKMAVSASACYSMMPLHALKIRSHPSISQSTVAENKPISTLSIKKWRSNVSFFSNFVTKGKDVERLKQELLDAIVPLDRGAEATAEDIERVDKYAREIEVLNQIKEPLNSNLLNGKWELLYTTSKSVLQTQRPKFLRPSGKIYQAINIDTLRAQNMETWPFFNQITANLVPLNSKRVAVKFDFFRIAGIVPIKNTGSGRGQLEITYLDEELRVSRGDKGNLFILKMVDPSYKVPV